MKHVLYILLSILILSACGEDNKSNPTLQNLNENKNKWSSANKPDYEYIYRKICFCAPGVTDEVSIEVTGNVITSITRTSDSQTLDSSLFDSFKTIDELFLLIEDAVDKSAHKVTTSYDSELGYPTGIEIDYQEFAIDDEITISASNLVPK